MSFLQHRMHTQVKNLEMYQKKEHHLFTTLRQLPLLSLIYVFTHPFVPMCMHPRSYTNRTVSCRVLGPLCLLLLASFLCVSWSLHSAPCPGCHVTTCLCSHPHMQACKHIHGEDRCPHWKVTHHNSFPARHVSHSDNNTFKNLLGLTEKRFRCIHFKSLCNIYICLPSSTCVMFCSLWGLDRATDGVPSFGFQVKWALLPPPAPPHLIRGSICFIAV